MKLSILLCLITACLFFNISTTHAQAADSLVKKADTLIRGLDSLKQVAKEEGGQLNRIDPIDYNATTRITPGAYFVLLGSDLKQEVTGPFHTSKKSWIKVGAFLAIEGALFFADKPLQRAALNFRNENPAVGKIGRHVTNFGGLYEVYTLGALGMYGFAFKNEKMKTTTLLASQAYITGGIMGMILKRIAGRERPNYVPVNGTATPTFKGPFADLGSTNGAFPSGHTTVAFAAATVYAMEYRNQPYIPALSYTVATIIGLSRITENKHWATDVFAGAALGFVTGRQVVNNYHRYAKLQRAKAEKAKGKPTRKKKGSTSFNLNYQQGMMLGNVTYTFR